MKKKVILGIYYFVTIGLPIVFLYWSGVFGVNKNDWMNFFMQILGILLIPFVLIYLWFVYLIGKEISRKIGK